MKLNYKRTIFVGFAFFLICAFWQAYDTIIPKILTDKFGMSQRNSGIIMALDNIFAIVMLPLFGSLSDKTKSKLGRRTPYILIGTIVAAIAFVGLSFVDNYQSANLKQVEQFEKVVYDSNYEGLLKKQDSMIANEALNLVYESSSGKELKTANGTKFIIEPSEKPEEAMSYKEYEALEKHDHAAGKTVVIEKSTFLDLKSYFKGDTAEPSKLYSDFYVTARQAYSAGVTQSHRMTIVCFILVLLIVLIAMSVFRSPAVALMPDVTIKPLRSKGNAVINLMGSAGGILVLILGMVFKTGSAKNNMMSYTPFFTCIAAIMIIALVVFMLTVREPKFVAEAEEQRKKYNIDEADDDNGSGNRKLSKGEKRSLILLLASVALWFMGYNAVSSKYSVYADKVLSLDYNQTLIIGQAAAIISYIPVGIIASKIGRKKTILAGIVMLTTAFIVASFLTKGSSAIVMNAMFALAGIGWATINVNSFPMVVELSKGSDVGKFTGYYYTASMAAQVITPYLSGLLMDKTSLRSLFPYSAAFTVIAFITMLFVMHGDSKPEAPKGIEAIGADD